MIIAVVSLSIAMALAVVSLSVSNTLLLLPPAGHKPDRLVMIYSRGPGEDIGQVSYPDYEYYRRNNHVFTDIAAEPVLLGVATDFNGLSVMSRAVSDNYFAVLEIRPYLGRFFSPGDDKTKDVAVLTYACWKRLGGDPNIIGKRVQGNTIVGVAPPEFVGSFYGLNGDLLTSLAAAQTDSSWFDKRDERRFFLIGRLKANTTWRQAQAELTTLSAQLASAYPRDDKDRTVVVTRATLLPPSEIKNAELIVGVLVMLVMLVLLIACANVANLLLAVAVGRRQEAAIKLALGAERGRLIREFLVETTVICGLSGAIGYLIAAFIVRHSDIHLALPMVGYYAFKLDLHLDTTVFALTVALVLVAVAASGVAPALYASAPNLAQVLSGEITVGGTRRKLRRNILAVGEVAVCTLVLIGMGICERSLYNLRHSEIGFTAQNLVTLNVSTPLQKGLSEAQGKELFARIRAAVLSIPGIQSVTLTSDLPIFSTYNDVPAQLSPNTDKITVAQAVVDNDYFETFGVRLLSGRAFDSGDRSNGSGVTVINRTMAEKLWPGEDPIGKSFMSGETASKVTVIGVTPDGKYGSLYESPRPLMYLPFSQHYRTTINVVARTDGDPRLWIEPMRQTVRAAGVDHVFEPMTLTDWMNFGLFTERATAVCVTVLAALGLLLAMSGLFGAISYSVTERKKEFGIRVALGARRGQLIGMVLQETVRVTAIGIFVGILPGVAFTTLLRSQLYGISPVEWSILISVGAAMMIVSLTVAYVSARPWIVVDPMEAVRHA